MCRAPRLLGVRAAKRTGCVRACVRLWGWGVAVSLQTLWRVLSLDWPEPDQTRMSVIRAKNLNLGPILLLNDDNRAPRECYSQMLRARVCLVWTVSKTCKHRRQQMGEEGCGGQPYVTQALRHMQKKAFGVAGGMCRHACVCMQGDMCQGRGV